MLYGSQKRFDKNGDGKLKGAEWQRWYQYTCGDEIEAKEKRKRANAAAAQKRAQIAADFADHVSDLINWMYRDLAHLEGERENQARKLTRVCAIFCARSGMSFSPHLMRAFIRPYVQNR